MKLASSVIGEMLSETKTFVHQGLDLDEAAEIVGLPERYKKAVDGADRLSYLPTPAEISAMTEVFRKEQQRRPRRDRMAG
ncbi:hypothetical protein FYK55_21845 [Roseiconus nitratireducens]|uniref:Uncharacterized protein n=1 Tax=Roseiconus nitratireducens TaxID=2605748 RepID=A0A5M6D1V8_9BACT|nr:hypothetical protein [Roseiconus nitratireducens]KAA5540272.1 hypothetical protein FYK55_21845 [Roseiconus nitratireducens]